ncbi:mCG148135 [Mus musculus]|nr:mCG148135 [Mus musculus]
MSMENLPGITIKLGTRVLLSRPIPLPSPCYSSKTKSLAGIKKLLNTSLNKR